MFYYTYPDVARSNPKLYSAFVVSIIRQAYAGKVGSTADSSWDDMPAALVSVAELMAGFLAASIPTYRPLWRRIFPKGDRSSMNIGDGSSGQKSCSVKSGQWPGNTKMQTKVSVGAGSRARALDMCGGISVTRDIELATHPTAGGRRDCVWTRMSDGESEDTVPR